MCVQVLNGSRLFEGSMFSKYVNLLRIALERLDGVVCVFFGKDLLCDYDSQCM